MMRLPWFSYHAPRTATEAARILAGEGPKAMPIAGGTDLLPNMKRRQQVPETLVSLCRVEGMKRIANGSGTQTADVSQLIKQFREMQRMMKQLNSGKGRGLLKMFGG